MMLCGSYRNASRELEQRDTTLQSLRDKNQELENRHALDQWAIGSFREAEAQDSLPLADMIKQREEAISLATFYEHTVVRAEEAQRVAEEAQRVAEEKATSMEQEQRLLRSTPPIPADVIEIRRVACMLAGSMRYSSDRNARRQPK